jgi:hypothetical protein
LKGVPNEEKKDYPGKSAKEERFKKEVKKMSEESSTKIGEEEFVLRAIKRLRKPPYRGIHSVYSGFNQAFKEHFAKNPVDVTKRMAEEGKIITRPVRGGVMLYAPDDAPKPNESVLQKILASEEES